MSGSGFFDRIREEGRLKLVEPSEEIKGAYLKNERLKISPMISVFYVPKV